MKPALKCSIFLIVILVISVNSNAQIPGLAWAKNTGALDAELTGISSSVDLSGNVYTTGYFNGTVDFDPGPSTFELTSNDYDGFVLKLDSDGNFVWAYQFGGDFSDSGESISIDGDGNVVLGANFAGTVNFDPGGSNFELTSFGGQDGVIIKLNSSGNFVFAKQIGGVDYDVIKAMQTDAASHIYLTGGFEGTADFNPGPATNTQTSYGLTDVFAVELDKDGNYLWSRHYGNDGDDYDMGEAVTVDLAGNVYIAGENGDSDSGNALIFVIKLDGNGNLVWSRDFGNYENNSVHSIQTDSSGDVYFSGAFSGMVDFDPSGTGFNLSGPDSYLCKFSSSGTFVWAKGLQLNPYNAPVNSMRLDINGNIFLTGYFTQVLDADPGPGIANIYSNAGSDDSGSLFVIKLDNNGDYVWAQEFISSAYASSGNFITSDNMGSIYVSGNFSRTGYLSTGICSINELTAVGEYDWLLAKINPTSVPATCFGVYLQPTSTPACEGTQVALTALAGGSARVTYQWQQFNGTVFADIHDQELYDDGENGYEGTNTPFLFIYIANSSGVEQFRCKVSGEGVTDTYSDIATLTLSGSTTIPYVVANSGCGPGQYLITGFGASDGNYRWYDQDGVEIIGEVKSTYLTPLISTPTQFSVSKGTAECQSDPVTIEVNTNACSPVPGLVWVAQPQETSGNISIKKLAIDAAGNIYAVGDFVGTVDFDSGPGISSLTTALPEVRENFLLKLTKNRDVVWVLSLGSTNINQTVYISLDGLGNIYLAGEFRGTVDFDPSPAIFNITATGSSFDMFITKLDINGNFIWAKAFKGNISVFAFSIASDGNGVYTTGSFTGTVDFDPNAGIANRTSAGSTAFGDIFISKLDASGNFGWAHRMGATSASDAGRAIKVDASGNVYSAGTFFGTVDFDPGAGVSNLTGGGATDLYIHKLNNAGIFQWARTVGGVGVEIPYALALDAAGNPLLAGTFETIISNQTVDFDPGAGTFNLVSNDGIVFVLKLTTDGNFTWAKNFGGTFASQPNDLTVDATGNALIIGYAEGNYDFDPGPAAYLLKSNVGRDIVVTQLDVNGNFSWAFNMASTGLSYFDNIGASVVTDPDGSIYTAGTISHSSDLDPGHCTSPLFASDGNAFIQKIKPGVATICFNLQPTDIAGCTGTPANLNIAATGTTGLTYQWQKLNTSTSLFEDITNGGGYAGVTTSDLVIDTNGNFGDGSYRCYVTGDNAPDKISDVAIITVNAVPAPPAVTGSTSCLTGPQTLVADLGAAGIYNWYENISGGIAVGTTSTFVTPFLTATTTYYVTVSNGFCESNRVPVEAEVNLTLTAPLVIDGSSCTSPASVTLTASGGTTGQYRWYISDTDVTPIAGETSDTYTTPILSTSTPYYVAINNGSCESARTLVNAIIENPVDPTTSGASRCDAGSVTVSATGGTDGQYRWYDVASGGTPIAGEVNSSYTTPLLSTTTNYFVSINYGTCESSRVMVTATIDIVSKPTLTSNVTPVSGTVTICQTESVTITAPSGFVTYSWSSGETTSQIIVSTDGVYTVTVTDVAACQSPSSDPITVSITNCTANQPPIINPPALSTQIEGKVAINLVQFITDPDDNLDLTTLKILVQPTSGAAASIDIDYNLILDYQGISFTGMDHLTIEVCDLAGSCASHEITVEVVGDIVVYNGFSPNGDGLNDFFKIGYIEILDDTKVNHVTIYTRWGDVVFEIDNYDNNTRIFEGLSKNGKELASGTYFYRINFPLGKKEKSGYLTLKR